MCLFVLPLMAHLSFAKLRCDKNVSEHHMRVIIILAYTMTEMELYCIAVLTVLRWAGQLCSQKKILL